MSSKAKQLLEIKNILEICETHGFLQKVGKFLKVAPTGNLLLENLKNEWFRSTVTSRDYTVFLNDSSFEKSFLYAKEMCSGRFPFGIAEKVFNKNTNFDINNGTFSNYFEENDSLRCTVFVAPNMATPFYHQLQRQRRMWWRIFSACPGRYSLSDIQNNGDAYQSVEIRAKYPWGSELVEKIKLFKDVHLDLTKDQIEGRSGNSRTNVAPYYVINEISVQTMLLNTLCDAYDTPLFQDRPRLLFRFHRKLAPYKISFSITRNLSEDLLQLAVFVCKQLRENNISCLLLPMSTNATLENQWGLYDCMGVPYNVLLNEKTLKNGIAQLRSRDTTLKEQVHVSELPKYVEQLFGNY